MLKCNIVKQLLPNYTDGLLDEESNKDVDEHLECCAGCRQECAALKSSADRPKYTPVEADKKELNFLVKMRKRNNRKIVVAVGITLVSLLLVFVLCVKLFFWGTPVHSNDLLIEPIAAKTDDGQLNQLQFTLADGQRLLVHTEYVFDEDTGEFVQTILRPVQAFHLPFDDYGDQYSQYSYGYHVSEEMKDFTILVQLADQEIVYTSDDFS